jgi:hypothetical protein
MNRYSIFSREFYITEDNKYDYSPVPFYTFPANENDKYIVIDKAEQFNPDLIAYNYYGDERLYWVILMANEIFDPFSQLYAGRSIRIPDLLELQMAASLA